MPRGASSRETCAASALAENTTLRIGFTMALAKPSSNATTSTGRDALEGQWKKRFWCKSPVR